MNYLDWNSSYETGIASVDHEHRRLVELLNEICDLASRGAEPAAIGGMLGDFHALASAHFALEERIMREEKHPDLPARRETHYRLLDQVRDIMDGYDDPECGSVDGLPETLKQWFLEAVADDVRLFAAVDDATLRRWNLSRA